MGPAPNLARADIGVPCPRRTKKYAHKNGMTLSIEPYDMNPTADLELGAIADVPYERVLEQGLWL
jgi:hypothetical protein